MGFLLLGTCYLLLRSARALPAHCTLVVFTFQIPSGGSLAEAVEAGVGWAEGDVPFFTRPCLVGLPPVAVGAPGTVVVLDFAAEGFTPKVGGNG